MAHSLDACDPNEDDVFRILGGFGDNITEQDAVIVINNMSNPDTALLALRYFTERLTCRRAVILYNVTMKVFRKCRDFSKAEKLFDEMLQKGVKPTNATFSTIITCARNSGLHSKAVEWFEKISTFGFDPDDITYSTMVDCYGRTGNVEMALSLYDRARTEKWRLDAVAFSTLIKIYGLARNYDGCLNVYEEMKALGAKSNLVIYNTLLDAMGRAKRPWQAKRIYNDLLDNGFSPSFATYATLLHAYGRGRYGEDALHIYRKMKHKGLQLNVSLYNTILSMCANLGYSDEATEIFEDMKNSGTSPDSWTFLSMITLSSCNANVSEAEKFLNEMFESGCEPDILVWTSLIQCYGKHQLTDKIVSACNRLMECHITPDDRFYACLLHVMSQTAKESLGKLVECVERANPKLAYVVKLLLEEQGSDNLKEATAELFDYIGADVKKAYCNSFIDMCINLNMLDKACVLLDLGLTLKIYTDIQSRTSTQWSLHLKSLSLGAALAALHIWINDLSKALESDEEIPPLLGISTGHRKHKYANKSLANVFESHLKELNAPFHEAPGEVGWFLTTKVAAISWLESRKSSEVVAA